MAYVGASTDNPYGWRPWVSRLGEMGQPEIYVPSATTPGGAGSRTVLGQELPEFAVRQAVTGAARRLSQYGTTYNPDYYLRRGMYSGRTLGQLHRDLLFATGVIGPSSSTPIAAAGANAGMSQYPARWSAGAGFPMSGLWEDFTAVITGGTKALSSVFGTTGPTATEDETKANAWQLAERLRQNNKRIIALENAVRSNPMTARAIGRDVIQVRNMHTQAVAKFQEAYRMLFGESARGLEAAVLAYAAIAAGVIAALALAWKLTGAVETYLTTKGLEAQAAASIAAQKNVSDLIAQQTAAERAAADAQARGDSAEAARQRQIATQLRGQITGVAAAGGGQPQPKDSLEWLKQNWIFIALATGGLILLPRLIPGK